MIAAAPFSVGNFIDGRQHLLEIAVASECSQIDSPDWIVGSKSMRCSGISPTLNPKSSLREQCQSLGSDEMLDRSSML